VYYLLLVVLTLIFLAPLIWMVTGSLKTEGLVFQYPPSLFADRLHFENYAVAWSQFPFWRAFANTMIITIGVEVGRILTGSLTAFVFARLRFPGRNFLFILVLSTMMIPYHITLIPQYLLFRNLGWLNSFKPLTIPTFFGGGAFFIFLLRQFFMTIPKEYDDASRIDGCGTFGIFWRIILPMSLPALGTVAIFTFMANWNDFLGPLIYLNSQEKYTLAIAIQQWQQVAVWGAGAYTPPLWVHILAMSTVLTVPPVLVYFFTQRYFIQGVVISGIKG
jgi:multiple sugar transport system permease protein